MLNKIKNSQKGRVFLFIIILVIVFCFKFFYLSKIKHIGKIRKKNQETSLKLIETRDLISKTVAHKKTKQELTLLKDKFPKEEQVNDILQYLTKTARKTNVNLVSLSFKPAIKQKLYNEIPIKVGLWGNYDNIVDYLDKLVGHSKIIDVGEIYVRKDKDIFPQLSVELLLMTYVLKEK